MTVHGDDFTTTGPLKSLQWFKQVLNKRYECKHKLLGPEGESTVRVLNRVFTWKEYIKGRVDDNFADLGEDDIQIEWFRI